MVIVNTFWHSLRGKAYGARPMNGIHQIGPESSEQMLAGLGNREIELLELKLAQVRNRANGCNQSRIHHSAI
jgi:hypothetical protein